MQKLRLNNNEIDMVIEEVKKTLSKCNKLSELKLDTKELNKVCYNGEQPVIQMTPETYIKMMGLVHGSDVEVAWHMLCNRNKEENTYLIYDILTFPQINSPTATRTDTDAFGEWMNNLIMDMSFPIEDMRVHGHSHVNMNVFSSGVDDEYQKELINSVEDGDYYIFLICNKRHEICALIYDFENQILFENKDIIFIVGEDLIGWSNSEIKEKCKRESHAYNSKTSWKKNKTKSFAVKDDTDIEEFYKGFYGGGY